MLERSHRARLMLMSVLALTACSAKGEAQAAKPPLEKIHTDTTAPKRENAAGKAQWNARSGKGRLSRTEVKGPRAPRLKWAFKTKGRVYGDAAVSRDGTVYIPSHDGHLYAVDRDGHQIWSFNADDKIWSSPAIGADGIIYFGSDADKFFALSPKGTALWTLSTKMPPKKKREKPVASLWDVDTSPVIGADGTIYFGCHYYLYAVTPAGAVRGRFQAGEDRAKIFSSPAVGPNGMVFFGTQDQRLVALDQNVNVIWSLTTKGDNDSTPAVEDAMVYFGSDDGSVRAIESETGAIQWITNLSAPIRAPLAISHDGTVLAPTYGEKPFIAALDGKTGVEKWRFHTEAGEGDFFGIQSGALVDGEGYIYFGGRDHYVYCLSPDGKLVWRYETGDQVDGCPVLGPDGTLYIGSDDGSLYAFERQ